MTAQVIASRPDGRKALVSNDGGETVAIVVLEERTVTPLVPADSSAVRGVWSVDRRPRKLDEVLALFEKAHGGDEALVASGNPHHCPPGDNGGRFTDRDASHCDSPVTDYQIHLFNEWQAIPPFQEVDVRGRSWMDAQDHLLANLSADPDIRRTQLGWLLTNRPGRVDGFVPPAGEVDTTAIDHFDKAWDDYIGWIASEGEIPIGRVAEYVEGADQRSAALDSAYQDLLDAMQGDIEIPQETLDVMLDAAPENREKLLSQRAVFLGRDFDRTAMAAAAESYQYYGAREPRLTDWILDRVYLGDQEYEPGFVFDLEKLESDAALGITTSHDFDVADVRYHVTEGLTGEHQLSEAEKVLAEKYGMTLEELEDEIASHVVTTVKGVIENPGNIRMRLPRGALEQVVADGHFESQFTSGTTRGNPNLAARVTTEHQQMGVPQRPEHRPLYAYSDWANDESTSADNVLDQYGFFAVTFKDHVKERTTLTFGDSLNSTRPAYRVGDTSLPDDAYLRAGGRDGNTLVEHIAWSTMDDIQSGENFGQGPEWSPRTMHYVEAQIHGGATVEDIEAIHVHVAASEEDVAWAEALAEQLGVPLGDDINPRSA